MKPSIRGGGGNHRTMNAERTIGNTLFAKVLDDEEGEGDDDMLRISSTKIRVEIVLTWMMGNNNYNLRDWTLG